MKLLSTSGLLLLVCLLVLVDLDSVEGKKKKEKKAKEEVKKKEKKKEEKPAWTKKDVRDYT